MSARDGVADRPTDGCAPSQCAPYRSDHTRYL